LIYLETSASIERQGMAKGSDKWGQGGGPRIRVEIILAVLVVASLAGVFFFYLEGRGLSGAQQGEVTTVTTTGIGCNDNSMPQAAQQVERDPIFTNLSSGLCYNYLAEGDSTNGQYLVFGYFNGTVSYPCGDAPLQLPASVIRVDVTSAQSVLSAETLSASAAGFQNEETCSPSIPLDVVSVTDVESTIPAVPQLNVTLAVPLGGLSITDLKAVLTLDGGSQIFQFGGVSSATSLASPKSASSTEIVLSDLSFKANEVYPMTISGTFDGGQKFSYLVHVQISQVP